MATKFGSISITWNQTGKLNIEITSHLPGEDKIGLLLAPSPALFISHQLGTMKPSHGLILCDGIFNYILNGKHIATPINSTLKAAEIIYLRLPSGNVAINFKPKHPLFHNSDSLEEGVRQLAHNYYPHVFAILTKHPYPLIAGKVALSQVIGMYQRLLDALIEEGKITPSNDKWSTVMMIAMAKTNQEITTNYGYDYLIDTKANEAKSIYTENFRNFYEHHKKLTNLLGLASYRQ